MKKNGESGTSPRASGNNKKKDGLTDRLFRQLTGLTLSEIKRKKKLEKILAGKEKTEPSAQQTISFEKVYRDGVCMVRSNYYTKMVEFDDINYVLLDDEERANILGLYSKCINYFNPSVKCQIFLINRRVCPEILRSQFEIALRGDSHDDIREEFSDMLKTLSTKGTNGIVKGKYLIFGMEAADLMEARRQLEAMQVDVLNHFREIGSNARVLDGVDRVLLLHDYFNSDHS